MKLFDTDRTLRYFLRFGCLVMGIALSVYAYLGVFTRYMADDYCLLWNMQSADVFSASWNKYIYGSNRFSNLFVMGFWELFPKNIAVAPALHVLLWVFGLQWLLNELNKLFGLKLERSIPLFAAEALVLFSFFTTPNLFQVLYWRPSQVTYLTPLVLFTPVAAWLVNLVRRDKATLTLAFLFGFFAFFIGGLSETLGTLHVATLSLAVICVIRFDGFPRRKPALTLMIALLVGAIFALAVMFLSPANAIRINDENGPPSVMTVLLRDLGFSLLFLRISITNLPLPIIVLLAVSGLLSYLFFLNQEKGKYDPRFNWVFLLIPLLLYGLVFAAFAPSAYGQSYPVERVRFPAHFILTLALTSLGICTGYVLSFIKSPSFLRYAAAAFAFVALLYPFWMIRQPLSTYADRRLFAQRWDEREQLIHELKANGERDLVIPGLDGYKGVKELDVRPDYWVNICAAQLYDVNSITAFSLKEEDVLKYFSE
jgi:hypothetical protein